jgi:L-lysine exporter family protein LysE/ArgO
LSCYGLRALNTAWGRQGIVAIEPACTSALTLKGTVVAPLGFTFLNPAAYVDTLLTVGTASSQYLLDERLLFGAGAILAAGLWFFALAYGASRLTHLFQRPRAWQTLDVVSGCIMLGMAGALCASWLM